MLREVFDREFASLASRLELLRSEKPCAPVLGGAPCDLGPLPAMSRHVLPVDCAESMVAIELAMAHLGQAVPACQPDRIRAAFALLQMGERALRNFLETKNVL